MTLPLLGLALDRRPPESLKPLLVALYRWCVPSTVEPGAPEPAAVMATVASAGRVPPGRPLAGRGSARPPRPARRRPAGRPRSWPTSRPPWTLPATGACMAPAGNHAAGRSVISPFVRRRLRWARGLPESAVLEQADDGWRWPGLAEPLADDLVPTAMACASAVTVAEPVRLLAALAWGAPCVSDPGSAAGRWAPWPTPTCWSAPAPTGSGAALAGAPGASTRRWPPGLGWAGRRLVEHDHDAARSAMRLAEAAGAAAHPRPEAAAASARLQLGLLGAPSDATIAGRFAEATAA